jgi:hypothetical protein
MASRFFTYCRQAGCTERHNNAGGYCAKHRGNNTSFRARQQRALDSKKNDPVWKLYACVAWTKRFRDAFFGHGNTVCQRLVDGVRCRYRVEILHHIISPRERADLMYHAGPVEYNGIVLHSQIAGVCRQHHPNSEGEPKENLPHLAEIYVPTVWREIKFC